MIRHARLAGAALWLAVAAGGASTAPTHLGVGNATASLTQAGALVGRWEQTTTCQQIVSALQREGLRAIAPVILAGNGLVPGTPKQLAAKRAICKGAVPRVHSHFFTRNGEFGSLDWNGRQVDDGPYRTLDGQKLRIGEGAWQGTFRYRIVNGRRLFLDPVVTAAAKRYALAHPLQFSLAGWTVAVALEGDPWKRVP